ncbi:hypothetical protein AA0Y32_01610 [Georgenia phoenicis]|uniref:hypothetical protein n=1 Tax=unclassified Georgenia TaxID=2626815 RepID=UPI0039B11773
MSAISEQAEGDGLAAGERERLVAALESRFAPHLEAAAAAVREAERRLTEAQERLAHAAAAAAQPYRSDPRVFMRETVSEDVEAIERKTTGKKVRAAYRFLLDRAVELAAGEVQGLHDDLAAAEHEREHGVDACRAAVDRAVAALEEARATEERVRSAEQAARQGLAVLVDKLTAP